MAVRDADDPREAETRLRSALARARDGRPRLEGWAFELRERSFSRASILEPGVVNPGLAPSTGQSVTGQLDLRWSDGRVSQVSFDGPLPEAEQGLISEWLSQSINDDGAVPIIEPCAVPEVHAHDPAVSAMVGKGSEGFRAELNRVDRLVRQKVASPAEISLRVGRERRTFATSTGQRVVTRRTAYSLTVAGMDDLAAGVSTRQRPGEMRVLAVAEELSRIQAAPADGAEYEHGERAVLFGPRVVDQLCRRFLFPNLLAGPVAESRSRFHVGDFVARRRVAAETLTVRVSTVLPFQMGTARCARDGTPGGTAVLIRDGGLMAPISSYRASYRHGWARTPFPSASPWLVLSDSRGMLSQAEAHAALDVGVEVHAIMGLHTQDPRAGRYALIAPNALLVRQSRVVARRHVRLMGDFLQQLQDPSTYLVEMPGEALPSLLLRCEVA
ncbi:MAG: metallopeptidase TldD-related protein [Chloroflexota bacterium]